MDKKSGVVAIAGFIFHSVMVLACFSVVIGILVLSFLFFRWLHGTEIACIITGLIAFVAACGIINEWNEISNTKKVS